MRIRMGLATGRTILAVLVLLTACEGNDGILEPTEPTEPANTAPYTTRLIGDGRLYWGGSWDMDLATYFSDTESGSLTYRASSSNSSIVATDVAGSRVTLYLVEIGTASITMTAIDPEGLSASFSFNVEVSVERMTAG